MQTSSLWTAFARGCHNPLSAAAAAMAATVRFLSTAEKSGRLIEMRQYTIKPEGMKDFMRITTQFADLRKQSLPLLGFFTCDIGDSLNRFVHFYGYQDYDERDKVRGALQHSTVWQRDYIDVCRPFVAHQASHTIVEAQHAYDALQMPPAHLFKSDSSVPQGVWEMAMYRSNRDGEELIQAFMESLKSRVEASKHSRLVFIGTTEVGMTNMVVELWRHTSAQHAAELRRNVTQLVKFAQYTPFKLDDINTSLLLPTSFSPWQ